MSGKVNRKVVISGMLGNGLEWYDYALYGILAPIFSNLFFPSGDESTALIKAYLAFAVGFIFRPLGAVIFGRIGDKYGRKKALVSSMILMAIATGCLGLLPTYDMIGWGAPLMLVMIRIIQGISLGGAFSGSMSYVVEHAPQGKRASIGSVTMLSLVIGFLFGSLVASVVSSLMSPEAFTSWGWRLPFFVGIGIGFVGYYIRHHGEESPTFQEAKDGGHLSDRPVREAFCKHPLKMLQGFNAYLFVTIPFYALAIYMISYTELHLGLSKPDALQVNSLAMIGMFLPIWPMGKLADRIGSKRVLLGAIIAMMIVVYPAFQIMQGGSFMQIAGAQFLLAFILGCYLAPIPALLVELFPTRIRYTGMALSYNFCAIIGGLTPSISEWLIKATGSTTSITYLLIGAGVASFISLLLYKDRHNEPLS
jgi:MHS family proline/betaine transporter-like MFS transporter